MSTLKIEILNMKFKWIQLEIEQKKRGKKEKNAQDLELRIK